MMLRNCALFLLLMVVGYSQVSIPPSAARMPAFAAESPPRVALQAAPGMPAKAPPVYGNNPAIPAAVYLHLHESRYTAVPVTMPAHANACPG